MADPVTWVSIISTVVGTVSQMSANKKAASAARSASLREQQASEFKKKQLEQDAIAATAGAQRDALNEKEREKMVMSRAMALSAASGAGASDPTVVNLLEDISGEGAYRQGLALYGGEERARKYRMGADAAEFEGQVAIEGGNARAKAYDTAAVGSAISGASSLFSKYGMGGYGSWTQADSARWSELEKR